MQHIDILWWVAFLLTALAGALLGAYCAGVARHYGALLDRGCNPDGACLLRAVKMTLARPSVSIIWVDGTARGDARQVRRAIARSDSGQTRSALMGGHVGHARPLAARRALAHSRFAIACSGALFPALYAVHGLTLLFVIIGWGAALLVLLACIDMQVQLLPDALTKPLLWVGLGCAMAGCMPGLGGGDTIAAFVYGLGGTGMPSALYRWADQAMPIPLSLWPGVYSVAGALVGYGLLSVPALWWRWRHQQEAVGQGDIKLLAAAGAWLGPVGVVHALTVACLAGVLVAMVHQRRLRPAGAYPFGPFIVLGCVGEFLGAPGVQSWF